MVNIKYRPPLEPSERFHGQFYSLQNAGLRTVDLRLELQETKRLPIVKPPLDFLPLDVPQSLFVEHLTDTPGDLRVA